MRSSLKLTKKWIRTVNKEEWYVLCIEAAAVNLENVEIDNYQENYNSNNVKVQVVHENHEVIENVFEN